MVGGKRAGLTVGRDRNQTVVSHDKSLQLCSRRTHGFIVPVATLWHRLYCCWPFDGNTNAVIFSWEEHLGLCGIQKMQHIKNDRSIRWRLWKFRTSSVRLSFGSESETGCFCVNSSKNSSHKNWNM